MTSRKKTPQMTQPIRVTVISGKNKKDRIIQVPAECRLVLIEYLKACPRKSQDFLFTALVRGHPLTPGGVRKTMRTEAGRALAKRRVYPHLWRHSLATNFLNRGASLLMIEDHVGYTLYESNLIYVNSTACRNCSEYAFFKPAYI